MNKLRVTFWSTKQWIFTVDKPAEVVWLAKIMNGGSWDVSEVYIRSMSNGSVEIINGSQSAYCQ